LPFTQPYAPRRPDEEVMAATTEVAWNARANNPYYRIRELTLPGFASTGLQRFAFKTTFLPHNGGHLLVKTQDHERRTNITAGEVMAFAGGTEAELVNTTDRELRFTVTEFK
jgi:hypothetical protein